MPGWFLQEIPTICEDTADRGVTKLNTDYECVRPVGSTGRTARRTS